MPKSIKLACACLLVFLAGCKVSQPGGLERAIAKQVKQKITVGGKDDVNPLPATAENIQAGQKAFSNYCIVCHGLDGQNTGVQYIRHLPPKGSLGEPAVYGGAPPVPATGHGSGDSKGVSAGLR